MPRPIPPFYENWDNTHCAQCVLRGIIEHFEPEARLNWHDMDVLTNKQPNKWTWGYRSDINMIKRGYEIITIGKSDPKDYLEMGLYNALVKYLGKEAAERDRDNSDHEEAYRDLQEWWPYYESGKATKHIRIPTKDDITNFLDLGHLIRASLNARTLNGREGYAGHAILIYDYNHEGVIAHDSGYPGKPARFISWDDYINASTNPTESKWYFSAYKKEKPNA